MAQTFEDAGKFGKVSKSTTGCVVTSGSNPPIWDIAKNEQNCNAVYLY